MPENTGSNGSLVGSQGSSGGGGGGASGGTPTRDAAIVGFSANTTLAESTQLYARYDGTLASGTDNHALHRRIALEPVAAARLCRRDVSPIAAGRGRAGIPDTRSLRRAGVLADGRVREVGTDPPRDMILSRIRRLQLTYDGDAAGAPKTLILKTRKPDAPGQVAWGAKEVAFYKRVAPATPAGLVPRCYEAEWQEESRDWHLLLEDLSDTHRIATPWPIAPSDADCRAIVGVQARFHAAWWDDQRLGVSVGAWVGAEESQRIGQYIEGCYRKFADRLGDVLSAERRALYERFLANGLPRIGARHRTRRHLTVIQGDAHAWNVFLPKEGVDPCGDGRPMLFDWDAWRLGVAAFDLAYLMATHWYPERRGRFERPLLDHYHATLVAAGVQGYDRRALDEDYRLMVLMQMMLPPIQADSGIPPMIWWSHLERIMLAVDDLGCRDLLA